MIEILGQITLWVVVVSILLCVLCLILYAIDLIIFNEHFSSYIKKHGEEWAKRNFKL